MNYQELDPGIRDVVKRLNDAGLMQALVPVDQVLTAREKFHGAVAYGMEVR